MATLEPISDVALLEKAGEFIRVNFNSAYYLIFRISIGTGYRISDVLSIKYRDINFNTGVVRICESKGRKSQLSRAKNRVLKDFQTDIIRAHSDNDNNWIAALHLAPHEVLTISTDKNTGEKEYKYHELVPEHLRTMITKKVEFSQSKTRKKFKEAKLPSEVLELLKARKKAFKSIDGGNVFSSCTLGNNSRDKNPNRLIARQRCHEVFSKLSDFFALQNIHLKLGPHSLRKAFARTLYDSSNDLVTTMAAIGHCDASSTLRYIGIEQQRLNDSIQKMNEYQATGKKVSGG